MKKCQALFFEAPYQVSIHNESMPVPTGGQVLVKTTFSAISAGTELLFYRGQFPLEMEVDASIDALEEQKDYPLKYGYMAVGVIEEIGKNLSEQLLEKRVFSFQPHQSHFVAKESDLIFIPDNIADEDAVFLPNMETAVNLVMDAKPLLGERVIIFGQGIVGLLVSAFLRQFPLEELVVVDPLLMRREAALALGVDAAFDPKEITLSNFDLALELSGVPEALNMAIKKVGFSGRVVVGSWYGQKPVSLDLGGRFHRDRIEIISSQVSTIAPELSARWDKSRRFAWVWKMLGTVKPSQWISSRIPLEEAEQVFATLDTNPQDVLQVVFEYI
ncbi:MAG: zinc-binding alcohol dehydrogenase [Anaerolineae bacterium]|jgi:2-desacetyl-2-hydroxyethyl bacteriochlorophyllide A dehydrogenase|nr:zinc-binding alcohol dehydrogenase [Anaerolineae bacterium]MBT7073808.1 zinc-binding alcohol dehydrogenase [Anaerolineae bacterium]MBT7783575.1 zinc-binding alcohol dehydrogenase [Anaerolineae bacterium]